MFFILLFQQHIYQFPTTDECDQICLSKTILCQYKEYQMVTTSIAKHNLNFEAIYICSALSFSEYISLLYLQFLFILKNTFVLLISRRKAFFLQIGLNPVMLKTEDSERVESILEHSEGTLLLFCEEEHFHVVLPFHKDVSPLFKLKPLFQDISSSFIHLYSAFNAS